MYVLHTLVKKSKFPGAQGITWTYRRLYLPQGKYKVGDKVFFKSAPKVTPFEPYDELPTIISPEMTQYSRVKTWEITEINLHV